MKNYINRFQYSIIKRLMSTSKNIAEDISKINNPKGSCSTYEHGAASTFEVGAGKEQDTNNKMKDVKDNKEEGQAKSDPMMNKEVRHEKGDKLTSTENKSKDFPHGYDKI
jgi:hypothetical protein